MRTNDPIDYFTYYEKIAVYECIWGYYCMNKILHNLMEDVINKQLDNIIDSFNGCKCEQCRLDIASYALNRLPAKYVVTTQGELITRLDSLDLQFEANVTTAITQGIILVGNNPRH